MFRPKKLTPEDELRDLGFGTRVTQGSHKRLLNPDGTFNVARAGLSFFNAFDPYNALLNMSWPRFNLVVLASYLLINIIFAGLFMLCGVDGLKITAETAVHDRFLQAFFFSVETLTTVGFGHIIPNTFAANILVTINAFVGLLGIALATGLLFARFSRPTAKIMFSKRAVVAPYRGISAFEFRLANTRRSQLIEVEAKVLLILVQEKNGKMARTFQGLKLERDKVAFFPLSWTIVHPIDEDSPLFGMTDAEMRACEAEVLILVTAVDDTFSQQVHARMSYTHHEITWGAKYTDMYRPEDGENALSVDVRRLHEFEVAAISYEIEQE